MQVKNRPVIFIRRGQSGSILSALFLDILISSNIPSFLKLPKILFAFVFKTSSYYKITHWLQIMEGKDISHACHTLLINSGGLSGYFVLSAISLELCLLNCFCAFESIVTSFYNRCI